MSDLVEEAKRKASYAAIDDHVDATTKVIGIGSGSTVVYCVERLAQRVKAEGLVITACIPTSFQAKQLIIAAKLPLSELSAYSVIDVNFDGADEIDPSLNCIKGGGGCHLQEKLVAAAAKKFVVVADYRKQSAGLGIEWKKGVPVEVIPMAYVSVQKKLEAMGYSSVMRMGFPAKAGPAVTDSGNLIIDVFPGVLMGDDAVTAVHHKIKMIPGVVETGLFIGMAGWAYLGLNDGSVKVLTNVTAQEMQSVSV